jgi:hypothetical protein
LTLQQITEQITQLQQEVDLIRSFERAGDLNLILETTLSADVASVTFSSISGDFRTLVFINQIRTDAVAELDSVLMRFNGDSGSNYDSLLFALVGDNTTAVATNRASTSILAANIEAANSRASNLGNLIIFIPNYIKTDREKQSTSISGRLGDASADADINFYVATGRWRDTSAITSVVFLPNTGSNLVTNSVFALYGIL